VLDRPWVRLLLGALAAALLGAMAARVAVSATAGPSGAGAPAGASSGAGGGATGGGSGGSSGAASGESGASGSGGSGSGEAAAGGVSATLAGGSGKVTVHVTGEVRRPGVYALTEGARVDDAVRRAGGATGNGDRQALNLAAPVRDGQQVRVPARAAPAGGTAGAAAAGAGAPGDAPVDLNTASVEELQTLDGVGPATAEKIVQLREERGGLAGVDDLDEVPGIGAKKLEALRAQLEG
jgi:competence protein ComEA